MLVGNIEQQRYGHYPQEEFISYIDTRKDTLMGWNSSLDTQSQIKIFFDTKEQAVNWAIKNKYQYFVEEPKKRKVKIKTYASNFDTDRKEPWTH